MPLRSVFYTALFLVCFCGSVAGQDLVVHGMLGARSVEDGDGFVLLELRAAIAPSRWVLRPTIGVSEADNIYSTQRELIVGAQGDIDAADWLAFNVGGGFSRLSQQGSEWSSGSSSGAYAHTALLLRRSASSRFLFAVDARHLAAPAFTRKDGLKQKVSFTQIGAGVMFKTHRR